MTSSLASAAPADLSCGARYFTPRSPERLTYGHEVSKISARLGRPFMPWQNMVVDTALEVDPETGLLAYRIIIIKVPRQAGKTALTLALTAHRAVAFRNITGVPQNIIYTAQTAQDAFKKWSDQSDELVSVLSHRVHKRGGNNSPTLTFGNASEYRPISVTKKSGPAHSNDLLLYDEAWGHEDGRIEAGLGPTTIARQQPQSWMYSNAGTRESRWWKGKWTLGRTLALAGDTKSGIAYFEWSASRDDPDYDPSNPEYVARHHPAAAITIDLAGFKAEYLTMLADPEQGLEGYERAYLNLEPADALENWLIVPKPKWIAAETDEFIVGRRAFALDITNDRSWASIGWSGVSETGARISEVVSHQRGTHWVVEYFVAKFTAHPKYDRVVYLVAGGQAQALQKDLEDEGITVIPLARAEYAAACAKYFDGLVDGSSKHLSEGQPMLESAIAGATWGTGDARVWDRRKSTTILSPLVAVTVAERGFALSLEESYDALESVA